MKDQLPNLVIAGVEKAGTTSLFNYLSEHPDICPSLVKELGYFLTDQRSANHMHTVEVYARQFDHCQGEAYRLEASPAYVSSGISIAREMKATLDRPKVIVMLRNPTQRLWSAYRFRRSQGHLEGEDTLGQAIDRWQRQLTEDGSTVTRTPLTVGRYGDYLGEWIEELGDDLRVVFAEHLATGAAREVRNLCRWLDIDQTVADRLDYTNHNATLTPRSRVVARVAYRSRRHTNWWLRKVPALRAALRGVYQAVNARNGGRVQLDRDAAARLDDYYQDSNAATARLLLAAGYDAAALPSWLQPRSRA